VNELVFPHDIKARQLSSGSSSGGRARSRYDMVREYIKALKTSYLKGSHTRILAKSSVADGIEAVRRMIPHMAIDPACTYLIDCFNNYSKEWDPKLNVWKLTPLHDEYSHGADVLRSVAVGHRESGESKMAIPDNYRRPRSSGHAV